MEGWSFYTSDELKARGWLRRQLALQAAGLCGNLDKIWPDVQRSAWIGGDRDGWERVPYWLDRPRPQVYRRHPARPAAGRLDLPLRGRRPRAVRYMGRAADFQGTYGVL